MNVIHWEVAYKEWDEKITTIKYEMKNWEAIILNLSFKYASSQIA